MVRQHNQGASIIYFDILFLITQDTQNQGYLDTFVLCSLKALKSVKKSFLLQNGLRFRTLSFNTPHKWLFLYDGTLY